MCETQTSKTESILHLCLEDLLELVWQGVAEKNIAKMAPKAMNSQTGHAVQSFVYQAFTEQYKGMRRFKKETDPAPAVIDTFGSGTIDTEQRTQRKMSKEMQPSIFGERSRSIISDISKKSGISGQLRQQKSKQNTEKTVSKQSFFVSLGYVQQAEDLHVQKMRKIQSQKQGEEMKTKRLIEERKNRNKMNALAKDKLLKEKGEITFDYQGMCYGVNPGKIQNQAVQIMKQFLSNPSVRQNEHRQIEPTQVQKQKPQQARDQLQASKSQLSKDKPEFSSKSFSLADVLGDPSAISQGVKITELRSNKDNLILQNKSKKLEGHKQYRLKDYKSLTKQKSFVEFSHTTAKKSSMYDLSLTPSENKGMGDIKAQTARVERIAIKSRGRSEHELRAAQTHTVLDNVLGRGLPFIRTKGLRFYDIGLSRTFRTLEPNSSSRRSSKSKGSRIKIDDCELFQQTILN